MREGPRNPEITFWRVGAFVVESSPAREPTCISVPAGIVMKVCLWLSWFFFWRLSTQLPISWWVTYQCTCPHCTECSAVFDQKWHDLHASPSLFTQSHPKSLYFLLPWMKKALKGNCFADMEEAKQKTAKALKGIKINKFKNCFEQWKKGLNRCIASNGEYFEGYWSLNMWE